MASIRSLLIRSLLVKPLMKPLFDPDKNTVEEIRRKTAFMGQQPSPRQAILEKTNAGELPLLWVDATQVPKNNETVILHIRGGGYMGSCMSHADFAARISIACGVRVLVPDYRLAPEHRYPAANDDCLRAYRWLINQGISPKRIIVGGDSWGAGLALLTLLSLRDAGEPLPAAAYLISPWDFIRFDGESYHSRTKMDPYMTLKTFQIPIRYYIDASAASPELSFLSRNLHGLPPLLIQTGDHEVVLSDSLRLAERARAVGIDVTLEIWDEMWHEFQQFAAVMPEARRAVEQIGRFVRQFIY